MTGVLLCRWCGATFDDNRHICPDGHLEDVFARVDGTRTPDYEEVVLLYTCGCSQTINAENWDKRMMFPERLCPTGKHRPTKCGRCGQWGSSEIFITVIEPYLPRYLPAP